MLVFETEGRGLGLPDEYLPIDLLKKRLEGLHKCGLCSILVL
ncbi:hypothetical protein HMPREF0322_01083, partial [Desulfitobacterium hafniense DP7]